MRRGLALAALLLVVAAGCGYSFRGHLPDHIRTVAVPVFRNHTQKPFVDSLVTSAMAEAVSTSGRLRLARPDDADALLEGEVSGYELQSIAFDPGANVRQYRLLLTLSVVFRDVRRNVVIFQQQHFQERSDFNVSGDVSQTIATEEVAVRKAAVAIAREVVARAVEGF